MNYTQNCNVCEKTFESKRPATLCSSTCRSKANRATDKLNVATDNATDNEPENIFEKLEKIRVKYNGKVTKEILTKETGITYTFIPNWLMHGMTLSDLGKIFKF